MLPSGEGVVEVTVLVTLSLVPSEVPITATLKEQLAPPARDAPLNEEWYREPDPHCLPSQPGYHCIQ